MIFQEMEHVGAGVWFGVFFHDISGDGACSSGAGARELLHAFFYELVHVVQ